MVQLTHCIFWDEAVRWPVSCPERYLDVAKAGSARVARPAAKAMKRLFAISYE